MIWKDGYHGDSEGGAHDRARGGHEAMKAQRK